MKSSASALTKKGIITRNGNGKQTDVLIRLGLEAKNDISDFRATMDLCFTNSPYSGVYRMQKEQFSEMKSCYVADTNAVYETMVSNLYEKRPHKRTIDIRLTEDSYFVFRIRATVDASGKLVSAHYGKILGPWEFFGTMRTGAVYFNPTPNDTNLEDAETARLSRLMQGPVILLKGVSMWGDGSKRDSFSTLVGSVLTIKGLRHDCRGRAGTPR